MSDTIRNYVSAIVAGNIARIAATLSSLIEVMPPGSNMAIVGVQKTSMMLSAVATVVEGFKFVRFPMVVRDMWYTILLEGVVDGASVQFIDQVHISEDGLVDHIDIFLRPASMAVFLLGKVNSEIQHQTTK